MTDFRQWKRPDDALKKITERIEADLGNGERTGSTYVGTSRLYGMGTAATQGSGMAAYEANRLLVEHCNHWQGGTTWPILYGDGVREKRLAEILPMFCTVDMAGDGVGRQSNALFGREPTIKIEPLEPAGKEGKPSEDQVREMGIALPVFSNWWDDAGLWTHVRKAGERASWGKRGPLRTRFLPAAIKREPEGDKPPVLVSGLTAEQALALVALSSELPADALVYTDPETLETACIIRVSETDSAGTVREAAEVWFEETNGAGERVTVRRILHPDGGQEPTEYPLPGGALPLHEITGELLITQAVRDQQAQVNFIKTMLTRIMQASGHRERYTIDAEDPGDWSLTPTPVGVPLRTQVDSAGNTLYFHPGEYEGGPSLVGSIQSRVVPTGKDDGSEQSLGASVVLADPVDPEYSTKALESAKATIRTEMKQGHAGYGDKAVSGEKVKQDRADFGKRCESYRQSAELAAAGVLTSAGRNAALLCKDGEWLRTFFDEYRIVCALHIDTGPLTAEEIKEINDLVEKGMLPRADGMARAAGVEDTLAADQAIAADPVQRMRLRKAALEEAEMIANIFNAPAAVRALRDKELFSNEELTAMGRNDFTGLEQ
jgi:hypothetical protein